MGIFNRNTPLASLSDSDTRRGKVKCEVCGAYFVLAHKLKHDRAHARNEEVDEIAEQTGIKGVVKRKRTSLLDRVAAMSKKSKKSVE